MVSFPPCKINLGLNVLKKRDDGYHDIETCFYPLPFTDILEVIPSSAFEFSSSGITIPGETTNNLCVRAYSLLRDEYQLPAVRIHLHKIIPAGAGLGGGSSDAAYTLRLLNSMFGLELDIHKLSNYAAQMGSDCSFFLHDSPMVGRGRGEVLTKIDVDLKGKYLVLLNPGIHVSTAEAYGGVVPHLPVFPLEETLTRPVAKWKLLLENDFEKSVFARFPLVSTLKDELYKHGAIYASMSGSGSSVFGIFENKLEVLEPALSTYVLWQGYL